MKVTIKTEDTPLKFPKLMINSHGKIVLFSKPHEGTVLKTESTASGYQQSMHRTDWIMNQFKDFKGELTIKQ